MRFVASGQYYKFQVLSFGVLTAPKVVTKCLAMVVAPSSGMAPCISLPPRLADQEHHGAALSGEHANNRGPSSQAGFYIKYSQISPSTPPGTSLPRGYPRLKRRKGLLKLGQGQCVSKSTSFSSRSSSNGKDSNVSARHHDILHCKSPHARLHMRPLQQCQAAQWSQAEGLWGDPVWCHTHRSLQWWNANILLQGRPFLDSVPQETIIMDASLTRWGAHLQDHTIQGLWTPGQQGQIADYSICSQSISSTHSQQGSFSPHGQHYSYVLPAKAKRHAASGNEQFVTRFSWSDSTFWVWTTTWRTCSTGRINKSTSENSLPKPYTFTSGGVVSLT